MKLNYINKIKANISISTTKKSTNLLEGTYKSIYKGKSLNFENLREYTLNDDVKDIDWKSSARTTHLLVKQFIAEKKHNIMLIMDTGRKMDADSEKNENKKELALYIAGTVGYIAIKNGDYVAMTYAKNKQVEFNSFKYNLYNLEEYLNKYAKVDNQKSSLKLNEVLKFVSKNIRKRMIIFVITDIDGLNNIEDSTLKKLSQVHDILFINIPDKLMNGSNVFDIQDEAYIPEFILNDKNLGEIEKSLRKQMLNNNQTKLKKNNSFLVSISSKEEINNKIIELLEEHKYAAYH